MERTEINRRVLVCLGGGLDRDWPSPMSISRLDKSLELFKAGDFNGIIVTSRGTFRDTNGHSITEARAQYLYLVERGMNPAKVYEEDQSWDTLGNAYFTKIRYLTPRGWLNPTVITNEFHMERVSFLFDMVLGKRYHIEVVGASNGGITERGLEKRKAHEETVLAFYKKRFAGVKKGDMAFLEQYMYKCNPAYNGGVMDESHRKLTEDVRAIWAA